MVRHYVASLEQGKGKCLRALWGLGPEGGKVAGLDCPVA